ncbi:MAG: radical SAM protein [bacterium]|nr:radical SAM protein [bacterium]
MIVLRQPVFGSLNLSERCPNDCFCYWKAQPRVPEMSDKEVLQFIEKRKKEGMVHVTYVGGEPYMRPKLLQDVVKIMPFNWVVTSGLIPLRRLEKTSHFISVDGADAETHNKIRGKRGLYERLVANLKEARGQGLDRLYLHTVLNAANVDQLKEIFQRWSANGLADGMFFSTHTPIAGANDEHLRLSKTQREGIVSRLLTLQLHDPRHFLKMTPEMIRRLHPDFTAKLTPQNCGTARYVASYYGNGGRIPQCVLSDKADCSQCGCLVMTMVSAIKCFPPELNTLKYLTFGLR